MQKLLFSLLVVLALGIGFDAKPSADTSKSKFHKAVGHISYYGGTAEPPFTVSYDGYANTVVVTTPGSCFRVNNTVASSGQTVYLDPGATFVEVSVCGGSTYSRYIIQYD